MSPQVGLAVLWGVLYTMGCAVHKVYRHQGCARWSVLWQCGLCEIESSMGCAVDMCTVMRGVLDGVCIISMRGVVHRV